MRETCVIRTAGADDIPAVCRIYDELHTLEETGSITVGWQRGVYPTRETAQAALSRGDLFVLQEGGDVVGAAVINRIQVDVYAGGRWAYPAADDEVMVLHTLVISPAASGKGLGSRFVRFYEAYALEHGCTCLRMDTNERNLAARNLYRKLGYREADIVPCVFNGLPGVRLVLLEKRVDPLNTCPVE